MTILFTLDVVTDDDPVSEPTMGTESFRRVIHSKSSSVLVHGIFCNFKSVSERPGFRPTLETIHEYEFTHHEGLNHLPHRSSKLRHNCDHHIRSSIFTTAFFTTIKIRKYPTRFYAVLRLRRTSLVFRIAQQNNLRIELSAIICYLIHAYLHRSKTCPFLLSFTMRHQLDVPCFALPSFMLGSKS